MNQALVRSFVLSGQDSDHDLTGIRADTILSKVFVENLIKKYWIKNRVPIPENPFPANIEHHTYNTYINNDAFRICERILAVHTVHAARVFFNNPRKFIIDRGTLTGCKTTPNKYSFAGWFDTASCKVDSDPMTVSVDNRNRGDLLALGLIQGNINQQGRATAGIYDRTNILIDTWEEQTRDYCRPEVIKYSESIANIQKNKTDAIQECFSTDPLREDRDELAMREADGKRSGDYLQIYSTNDDEVFITQDRMAAVKAAILGKNVIHTYQQNGEFYVRFIKLQGPQPSPECVALNQFREYNRNVLSERERAIRRFYTVYEELLTAMTQTRNSLKKRIDESLRRRTRTGINVEKDLEEIIFIRTPDPQDIYKARLAALFTDLNIKKNAVQAAIEAEQEDPEDADEVMVRNIDDPEYEMIEDLVQEIDYIQTKIIEDLLQFAKEKQKENQIDNIKKDLLKKINERFRPFQKKDKVAHKKPLKLKKKGGSIDVLLYKYVVMIKNALHHRFKTLTEQEKENDMSQIYLRFLEMELAKENRNMCSVLHYIELLLPFVCKDNYFRTFNESITTLRGLYVLESILMLSQHKLVCSIPENINDLVRTYIEDFQKDLSVHIKDQTVRVQQFAKKLDTIEDKIRFLEEIYVYIELVHNKNKKVLPSYVILKDIYYRTQVLHYKYLYEVMDSKVGGGRDGPTLVLPSVPQEPISRLQPSEKDIINSKILEGYKRILQTKEHIKSIVERTQIEVNEFIQSLTVESFINQPFAVKRYVVKQSFPTKEKLLQGLFMEYYSHNLKNYSQGLSVDFNALQSVIPLQEYSIEGDQCIRKAYTFFRNYIAIFPEYLDPLTFISMKYMTDTTPMYPRKLQLKLQKVQNIIEEENKKTIGGKGKRNTRKKA